MKFPKLLFKKLLNKDVGIDDLKAAFPEVGKNLDYLLQFDGDIESTFLLNFTVSYDFFGTVLTRELKLNGASIPVTNDNRTGTMIPYLPPILLNASMLGQFLEYIKLYVNWMLNESVEKQFAAFMEGFLLMCKRPCS